MVLLLLLLLYMLARVAGVEAINVGRRLRKVSLRLD
jgi:hypothetical protein